VYLMSFNYWSVYKCACDGGMMGESVRIRVIRGICVLSFFDGSVILRVVVAWGLQRRRRYINLKLINFVGLCGSFFLSL